QTESDRCDHDGELDARQAPDRSEAGEMTRIHAERALLPEGWARDVGVSIEDGRIAAVIPAATPDPGAVRASVLLPAPANLHSHSFQRAMAGMTEARGPAGRDSF